jgi:hypothetical protein
MVRAAFVTRMVQALQWSDRNVVRRAMVLSALLSGVLAGAAVARADERSTAIVETFRAACVAELPNFARLDAKAQAQGLPVNMDAGTPRRVEGYFNHIKSWLMKRADGVYELSAVEARGPAGEFATCALLAPDGLGDAVRQELSNALNLGPPEREAFSPDGQKRQSSWHADIEGERVILLMLDASPTKGPGVYLNLTHQLVGGT